MPASMYRMQPPEPPVEEEAPVSPEIISKDQLAFRFARPMFTSEVMETHIERGPGWSAHLPSGPSSSAGKEPAWVEAASGAIAGFAVLALGFWLFLHMR